MYLTFEKEIVYFSNKYLKEKLHITTLFNALKSIETYLKINIDSKVKAELNKYRHIINVYKHGDGESFNELKELCPDILNHKKITASDTSFVFNLNLISVDILYNTLIKILHDFKSQ